MREEISFVFGPFRLDVMNACLLHGQRALVLTPKAFAVLRYLLEHPSQLVTKKDLFQTAWPDTYVSDAALSVCIREIRKALQDDPKAPRYIETVHRRGFRFIGEITSSQYFKVGSSPSHLSSDPRPSILSFVGRKTELSLLHQWLERALQGERQIVFVTGESGVGKTSLVKAFQEHVATLGGIRVGLGQCIEHFGAAEAYLPVLTALGQVGREPGGRRVLDILSQHAPTWLLQMPALLNAEEYEALHRRTLGVTRERMLREMAEALEIITAERPLVLVLEDLHWSDASTLDLIAFLARRHQPARLLVLGTYRPVEAIVREHPLRAVKQELQIHGQCRELPLRLLNEQEMGEYLERRCPGGARQPSLFRPLVRMIHLRTDGNPLFMVNVVEDLVARGLLVCGEDGWEITDQADVLAAAVPENLRQMVEAQFDRLNADDRQVLEVASVAGRVFSAAAVAAGLTTELGEVEERCTGLTRRSNFLQVAGVSEWPDGTVVTCYSFSHAFYQDVIYERLQLWRRMQLHQRIGEREETAHGEQTAEVAAELAIHFERGRDYHRAVRYYAQAGQTVLRRHAYQDARILLTKGLGLLKSVPDTFDRAQQELRLQIALGALLQTTKGYAAPEVETVYGRARELCQQLGETAQLFPVLRGLWVFYLLRAELPTAHDLGRQLFTLAQNFQDPVLVVEAHYAAGTSLFFLGDLVAARAHLEQCRALYDRQQHRAHVELYGQDPGVFCRSVLALALWLLGYSEQAQMRAQEAMLLAQQLAHPNSQAAAEFFTVWLNQLSQDAKVTHERAADLIAFSREQGFPFWLAWGTVMEGSALIAREQEDAGIAQIRQGLSLLEGTGAKLARPYVLAVLTSGYEKLGRFEDGHALLTEAMATIEQTGERLYEAELHRLRGALVLQQENQKAKGKRRKAKTETNSRFEGSSAQHLPLSIQEAEPYFHQAIKVARLQQAKSLELRATMSLIRLWRQQGKQREGHECLSEIYGWFTEGFETKDLQEAKTLLCSVKP